jgi:beta-glucosidase
VSLLRLGVLDDPPTGTPATVVTSAEHSALAREAAAAGVTLLLNRDGALPLDATVKSVAVIGSAGGDAPYSVGGGSAYVNARKVISPLAALQAQAGSTMTIAYVPGDGDGDSQEQAVGAASTADAAIVFAAVDSTEGGDRDSLALQAKTDALNQILGDEAQRSRHTLLSVGKAARFALPSQDVGRASVGPSKAR